MALQLWRREPAGLFERAKADIERVKASARREEQLRFALEQKIRELEAERAKR